MTVIEGLFSLSFYLSKSCSICLYLLILCSNMIIETSYKLKKLTFERRYKLMDERFLMSAQILFENAGRQFYHKATGQWIYSFGDGTFTWNSKPFTEYEIKRLEAIKNDSEDDWL